MDSYIVDIQGYRGVSTEFVLKEISIQNVHRKQDPIILNFLPPCEENALSPKSKKTLDWLLKFYHGIPWTSGSIPYRKAFELLKLLLGDADIIYVKGVEKKRILEKCLHHKCIFDLEKVNCPRLKEIAIEGHSCGQHNTLELNRAPACAVQNSISLKKWLIDNVLGEDVVGYKN